MLQEQKMLGSGWLALLVVLLLAYLGFRLLAGLVTPIGRARLYAGVSRLWRWEFWPTWLFYLPILPWLAYLSLRYRGLLTWTAANPGIPQGGVVGESKYAILTQLPKEYVVPSMFVPPEEVAARLKQVCTALAERDWTWPLILKPDASQRGAGVKRVWNLAQAEKYLQEQPAAVLVQPFHPGPYEAGLFYYRIPGKKRGCLFSVTDKAFPMLVGDGRSTLEELIWRHPRFRMQARTFLTRHHTECRRILAQGEHFTLALAGNHCQGAMFRDGKHLITPELKQAVDAIAQRFQGFYIGRFDVRYSDAASFQAGKDFAIIELNGVTSESTNIYDPSFSLLAAYRTLARQWALLYRIGHANLQRGHVKPGILSLLAVAFAYYRNLRVNPIAD